MATYIKKSVSKKFVTLQGGLEQSQYINQGVTLEDYNAGLWVKLSDEQELFHKDNPGASVEEVWNMNMDGNRSTERTLESAKNDLIATIELYDKSTAVDSFIVNDSIRSWLTVEERLNYKQSVEAAKLLGEESLDFLLEGIVYNIAVHDAEMMLAMIQRYADKCFMVTAYHKETVKGMTSLTEVDSYDYMSFYPEPLKFQL